VRDFALAVPESAMTSVWEIDQRSGLVRHTELQEADAVADAMPQRDVWIDASSLRERDLSDWDWESAGLIDPVAALLAPEVTDGVAWTTLAPASGATPTRGRHDARRLTWSGQGSTFSNSRRSAVLEGIERLVGAQQFDRKDIEAPARELSGRIITPAEFDRYPDEAYGTLVEEFDVDRPHEWVAGAALRDGAAAWIPREFVFYSERPRFDRWARGTSSGCATGSSDAEATVFGLLELIERDTFVNAWYGGIPALPVDPDTVDGISDILARIRLLGWDIELGLLRNAWLVPVFVATVDTGTVRTFGAAAHLDLATAARRAMTEAITYAPGRLDEIAARADRVRELLTEPRRATDIEDHPLLPVAGADPAYASMCGDTRSAQPLAAVAGEADGGEDMLRRAGAHMGTVNADAVQRALVDVLARDGIETFRVVQTAPFEKQLGLSTVMTLAPGLSQLDFGWSSQRVRTSRRPVEQLRRITGQRAETLRLLPHPFS